MFTFLIVNRVCYIKCLICCAAGLGYSVIDNNYEEGSSNLHLAFQDGQLLPNKYERLQYSGHS
ncbi:hypothetical protein KC19_12G077400 [Ceratodon purpureus]|uniref:Uncharacterized protein n=1 Tax=Ceratodon purpureus TaxID=3225 RepID=A0A8T0G5C8_CERPU|nr:hypothetical protein KC19_12G077400 [Ceratodon purpureus]